MEGRFFIEGALTKKLFSCTDVTVVEGLKIINKLTIKQTFLVVYIHLATKAILPPPSGYQLTHHFGCKLIWYKFKAFGDS